MKQSEKKIKKFIAQPLGMTRFPVKPFEKKLKIGMFRVYPGQNSQIKILAIPLMPIQGAV